MSSPIVLALPAGAKLDAFADGCRDAALDFVNRVSVRPDKAVLADWLRGPYRAHVVPLSPMRTRRIDSSGLIPGALDKLLDRARREVARALYLARDPAEGVEFGYSALAAGLVYRARDVDGADGWVPVALPRMRLVDRVLSLVAADYLLRTNDYETSLFECLRCECMTFDKLRIDGGVCQAHAHDVRERAKSDIRELAPGGGEKLASAG